MQLLAVNYHYIRDVNPSKGIYSRSIDEMAFQLDKLGQYYDFISQEELLKIVRSKKYPKGNYCVITFDDNLKEQMKAYEYLEKNSIPAIFFSTTLPYLAKDAHDVHKLHHIYTSYSDNDIAEYLEKKFKFYDFQYNTDDLEEEYRYDTDLKKKIKFFLNFILPEKDRRQVVNSLFNDTTVSSHSFIKNLYMGKDDLKLLANNNLLGTHTHTHLPLATLAERMIKDEIGISLDFLSKLTGKPIKAISYPFGGPGAVNNMVSDVAKEMGLVLGFTMNRGMNIDSDFENSLLLKRVDTNDAPGGKLESLVYCP